MELVKPFRVWPYLVINLIAAVWLDLTSFHNLLTSDSIVFVLASLYEMRPFFWEQDRIGMLIPLAASWCDSPFHNLLLQTGAMIFIGLTMPVMLARVLTPHRMAPLAITLCNALFLLLAPSKIHENWLLVCNYPSALLLGLFAVSLVDRYPGRVLSTIACAVLLLLAHWQYFGVILYLGPLIAFRAWCRTGPGAPVGGRFLPRPFGDARSRVACPLALVAFGAIWLAMTRVRNSNPIIVQTSSDALPAEHWPETWQRLIATTAALPRMDEYALGLMVVCGIGLLLGAIFNRRTLATMAVAALPALLAAIVELGILGTREWTAANEYHPRYLVAATTTVAAILALLGLVPLLERIPRRREPLAIVLAGLLVLAGATGRYGWPSPQGVRTLLDEKCGTMTPLLLETQCEAVGGDYWVVWLAMFHVNMTLHERGDDRVVFGLGYRCEPMTRRWANHPDGFRIGLPNDELPHVVSPAQFRGIGRFEKIEDRDILIFPGHNHAPTRPLRVGIYRVTIGFVTH